MYIELLSYCSSCEPNLEQKSFSAKLQKPHLNGFLEVNLVFSFLGCNRNAQHIDLYFLLLIQDWTNTDWSTFLKI